MRCVYSVSQTVIFPFTIIYEINLPDKPVHAQCNRVAIATD